MLSDTYKFMIGRKYLHEVFGWVTVIEFMDWKEYPFVARVQKSDDNRIVFAFSLERFNIDN